MKTPELKSASGPGLGLQIGLILVAAGFGVSPANGPLPQRFYVRVKVFAGLLAQNIAQQHAQRAHIAAQRSFFQLAGLRLELGQPL